MKEREREAEASRLPRPSSYPPLPPTPSRPPNFSGKPPGGGGRAGRPAWRRAGRLSCRFKAHNESASLPSHGPGDGGAAAAWLAYFSSKRSFRGRRLRQLQGRTGIEKADDGRRRRGRRRGLMGRFSFRRDEGRERTAKAKWHRAAAAAPEFLN